MKPRVDWDDEAELFLLAARPSEAERILQAVEEMATRHRGFVRRMEEEGAGLMGLYLTGYVVLFHLDPNGDVRVDSVRVR